MKRLIPAILALALLTTAHAGATLPTYHGGRVISHPKVAVLYVGTVTADHQAVEAYVRELTEGSYLFNAVAYNVGPGAYLGAWQEPHISTADGGPLQVRDIEGLLGSLSVLDPTLPAGSDVIWMVLLGDGGRIGNGGAFHGAVHGQSYALIHAPSDMRFIEIQASHEFAETPTDADPADSGGWFAADRMTGEIADLCNGQLREYAGGVAALYATPDGVCR